LMLPAVFGASIYQINIFIATILASLLPSGSVSYLYYADRVVELPLGVFAIAIGTAALPSFSDQVAKGDFHELKGTINFSLRLILFVTIPATVALIVLRVPIISVLFQRGAFDIQSTFLTAQALLCYALGLWAFSVIRVIVSAFYSLQDSKTPMKAGIVAFIVNVICSIVLMYPLKHSGLALATSIATAVNVIMLTVILKRRIGAFWDREFYKSVFSIVLSSIAMCVVIVLVGTLLPWVDEGSFNERLLHLMLSVFAGMATFFIAACLTKCSEMTMIVDVIKRRMMD
ncbi:MAG: murein biosynthesis integral membrane protein MurJ, partial [Syntrophales bacterium]